VKGDRRRRISALLACGVGTVCILAPLTAVALLAADSAPPSGEEVMRRVNTRPLGGDSTMELRLLYRDFKQGQGDHTREVAVTRKLLPAGYRTSFRITAPPHLAGIALLLLEDAEHNGMWMYFPEGEKLVPVVTRGLSALASDFSCEDLRVAFPLKDYDFRNLGLETLDGRSVYRIEMVPRGERLQQELRVARAIGWVLADRWILVQAEYFASDDVKPFKVFHAERIDRVDGVWTVRKYSMVNHRAGHATEAEVVDVHYHLKIPAERLAPEALRAAP
jgi:hypothetical protein